MKFQKEVSQETTRYYQSTMMIITCENVDHGHIFHLLQFVIKIHIVLVIKIHSEEVLYKRTTYIEQYHVNVSSE